MILNFFRKKQVVGKVKCQKCGCMILEATAFKCGGICMPCFMKENQGHRPDEIKPKKNKKLDRKYVNDTSKIILRDSCDDFYEHISLLDKLPGKYLELKLNEKYDFHPNDWVAAEKLAPEYFFEAFMLKEKYSIHIDWSGEDDRLDLFGFIQKNLKFHNKSEWNISVIDDWESTLNMDELARGDYIHKKFIFFGNMLEKVELILAFLDTGGDNYFPLILSFDEFKHIPKKNNKEASYGIQDYKSI